MTTFSMFRLSGTEYLLSLAFLRVVRRGRSPNGYFEQGGNI